jgi:uncharacterized protein
VNRRHFLLSTAALAVSGCKVSFEQGMRNPCKSPNALASYPAAQFDAAIVRAAWLGIDPTQVWDTHAHLFGDGDSGTGIWLHPDMSEGKTLQGKVQRTGYLNAGCVIDRDGQRDKSMLARLQSCAAALPAGAKVMAFAFDYAHNELGERVPDHSTFYVPDSYARDAARRNPERLEWVASIHPYRKDALEALVRAKAEGARAVKWLPAAQGMNPSSPLCKPFFRALAAARLPLIIHAGKELAVKGPDTQTFGNPLRLRAALDEGVRVIVAHCASLGNDTDLDQGEHGPEVDAFALFARMMDAPHYQQNLFADLSAVAQMNRMDTLPMLLRRSDWHPRLLNGSDYPLPGVMPLYSLNKIVEADMLDAAYVPTLRVLREHNPLLFDFVLKRTLALGTNTFSPTVFQTRRWFV